MGVVNLSTDSYLPPIFFHGLVMVAPRDANADVHQVYQARYSINYGQNIYDEHSMNMIEIISDEVLNLYTRYCRSQSGSYSHIDYRPYSLKII